jgi:hypothetical protein
VIVRKMGARLGMRPLDVSGTAGGTLATCAEANNIHAIIRPMIVAMSEALS